MYIFYYGGYCAILNLNDTYHGRRFERTGEAYMTNDIKHEANKPVIGAIPLFDDERDSIWMLPGYMDGIRAAGGLPVILPFVHGTEDVEQVSKMIDGLLLTGGQDVAPGLYNETPISLCGKSNKERDALEYALLDKMLKQDKPVFGICRGIQLLNVYLGGTLYQDIPEQLGKTVIHTRQPGCGIPEHKVRVAKDSPLFDMLKKSELSVNSYHHQGVKRLAESLMPMARAEDGLTEAAYMSDKTFVMAVQWHPELMFNTSEDQLALFRAFVNACG